MLDTQIIYKEKIIPDAYHGTSLYNATSITRAQQFIESVGDKQFLGNGIYFWEASINQAIIWAKRKCREPKTRGWVVFKAIIELGKCLDLAEREHISLLEEIDIQLSKKGHQDIPDAVLINYLAEIIDIDTVRGYFPTSGNRTISRASKILRSVQVIICVRVPERIKSFEIHCRGDCQ